MGYEDMKAVFYTNKGCVRKTNEDALIVGGCAVCGTNMTAPSYIEIDADKEFFCVIDGMGGHFGGAVAARITAQAFQTEEEPGEKPDNKIWLESILQRAYEGVLEAARCSPELAGMGATLAGAVIDRGKKSIFAFNLGDCRVYRFQDGFLDKLTHDHSRVQELFDRGEITEEYGPAPRCEPYRIFRSRESSTIFHETMPILRQSAGSRFWRSAKTLCCSGSVGFFVQRREGSIRKSFLPLMSSNFIVFATVVIRLTPLSSAASIP